MAYVFEPTERFRKMYRKKSQAQQQKVERALELLGDNPRHPGLETHRIRGTRSIWECYIDDSMRITFEYGPGSTIILRNNCNHDIVSKSP